jgi:uncharacterized membrane protein YbhN (UPF0104 family)
MTFTQFMHWFWRSNELKALRARQILRLLLVLGLFVVLFWAIPINDVVHTLRTANLWLFVLGLALSLFKILFSSFEMLPLITHRGIKRNILQVFAINLSVKFYLLSTPTSLVGSGVRWYRLSQPEGKVVEALVALAFYRLFDTFLTLIVGCGFFFISAQKTIQLSAALWVFLVMAIVIAWILIPRLSASLRRFLEPRLGKDLQRPILRLVFDWVAKVLNTTAQYANMPLYGLMVTVFSGMASALVGIGSGILLANAVGIHLNFSEMGWILSVTSLATQLPFTVAEGLGIREVTLIALLSIYDIAAAQALAFSLLVLARNSLAAIIGGFLEAIGAFRLQQPSEPGQYTPKQNGV